MDINYQMEINNLPDEILLQIFSFIELESLYEIQQLSLICKRWRGILWTKEFFRKFSTFKYQSKFLSYYCSPKNLSITNHLSDYVQYDQLFPIPYLTINGDLRLVKQDIQNCPLVNTTVSFWLKTIDHLSVCASTILLLWHFNFGHLGFYRDLPFTENALIKCSYTKQYELRTTCILPNNQWQHIAIVIKEKQNLQLYINGNRVGSWPFEEQINRENRTVAPHSSIWFGSHCGVYKWHGSLSDICIWKRCLQPYEIEELAREPISIENINFLSRLQL